MPGNILIADAGSSKTDWSLINKESGNLLRFHTSGINPAHDSPEYINICFNDVRDQLGNLSPDRVYFYGSGCATTLLKQKIADSLSEKFPDSYCFIESDLFGAYRALFGDMDGIACILGTGSSTAYFTNGEIRERIPSLGFILGDEGGGVSLGKNLLNSVFKESLSKNLIKDFHEEYNIELSTLINEVYQKRKPATFIASFTPFLLRHIAEEEIKNLVSKEFDLFFKKNVLPYSNSKHTGIGIVGSIAFYFQDILRERAEYLGLKIDKILKEPLPELEKYHQLK